MQTENILGAMNYIDEDGIREIFEAAQKRLLAGSLIPSEEMQAAVRTVFQLFCKEGQATFTEFGAEEADENPWSQHSSAHKYWLAVTEDMMKSCNIETVEEMIKCLALMIDIIGSVNKVKHKNEKAFGLYIYYISQEATDIDHLKSPEYWSEEKQNESYDNVQGEGTEV